MFKEEHMETVARVTTITSRSTKSFEHAVSNGVERASKTLRNVSGAWVKEQKVEVTNGAISEWQVTLEVTFVLED
jgi:dodecin